MFRVRPVMASDHQALLLLAEHAGVGVSSLIADPKALKIAINCAESAFNVQNAFDSSKPFIWVLEDLATKAIVGCATIKPNIAGNQPFYTFAREFDKVHSTMLNQSREDEWLYARDHFKAVSELASLCLHRDYREQHLSILLSYARLLFIACFRNYFQDTLIAEVRGVSDDRGQSPFWDAVGRHFFHMDFAKADALCLKGTTFIGELMPRVPLLTALLPRSAQAVIGVAHKYSQGAEKLLDRQGMKKSPYIDIFDAGPLIWGQINDLAIVKTAQLHSVRVGHVSDLRSKWLIRHTSLDGATVYVSADNHQSGENQILQINAQAACALGVVSHDNVFAVKLANGE